MYCTKTTRKEALWLISNIAANSEQEAIAISNSGLFVNLLMSCRDSSFDMRKEAVWAVSNVLHYLQEPATVELIVQQDVMSIMLEMLQRDAESGSVASLALSTINELLTKSETARTAF